MTAIYKSAAGEARVRELYAQALTQWPLPHEERRLATSQGETFVVVSGPAEAPALVLLHGSGTNTAMWMGDVAAWAEHFRVHAVDIVGEPGFSAPSRPPLGSDAYARWLDEVLDGLGLERAAFVGASLGGWFALDYATRRPTRVEKLVLVCPGGIGRQKSGFIFQMILLIMLGAWGRRKAFALVSGVSDGEAASAGQGLAEVFQHFRPRTEVLPVFNDAQLASLPMPVMLVVGGKDVMLDSDDSRRRVAAALPAAEIRYLPEVGHVILGQTQPILQFLRRPR